MSESKIVIGFKFKNEFGDRFEAESEFPVFDDISHSEIDEIGMKFNAFLRQAGYARKNDFIFMEDVTEEECEALYDFLEEYRNKTTDTIS